MRNKRIKKVFYFQILPIFLLGFSMGIFSIWPGIITGNGRKCFFNILKDGSDGNIKLKTIVTIDPNYLLQIKSSRNIYFKVLFVGDSCFRKF